MRFTGSSYFHCELAVAALLILLALPIEVVHVHASHDGERQGEAIVINEFMPTPSVTWDEWIELYNPSEYACDISGYMIDDMNGGSDPYVIPSGTMIPPLSFLVFAKNETGITLNSDKDSVRLLNRLGEEIDNFTYTSSTYDVSYGRMPDGGSFWTTFTYPTRGTANGVVPPPTDIERKMLLAEVYYNAYSNRYDEFVMIYNPTTYTVDLSQWRISNNRTSCIIPDGFSIGARSGIYITNNGTSFILDMGFSPALESSDSSAAIPNALGNWPTFSNSKGLVLLKDRYGNTIDCFVYGTEIYYGPGWLGGTAPALPSGQVQKRNKIEGTMEYIDTNTSSDWTTLRQYVVGQSDFPMQSFTYTGEMVPFVSPENAFDAIATELDNARSTIYLNVYQFDNWPLAEHIFSAQLNRSVKVKVLFEGGPVGWNFTNEPESVYIEKKGSYEGPYTEKLIASRIVAYGGEVRFLSTNGTAGLKDRYTYDHAKYAVIDNSTTILCSENWKETGVPKLSSFGNRGWGVIIKNEEVAQYFAKVFDSDFNPLMADSYPFTPSHGKYGNPPSYFRPDSEVAQGKYKPLASLVLKPIAGTFKVTPVLSPDHTLYENSSIIGAIESAKKEIVLELAQLDMDWRPRKGESVPNMYLEALFDAARRGVKVRIILDPTFSSEESADIDNYDLASYINYVAQTEKLNLKAKLVYIEGTEKIHNKGMIVDDYLTLVSSLNWGRGSVTSNREVGVLVENMDLAAYFKMAFEYDWNQSSVVADDNAHNDTSSEPSQLMQMATCILMIIPLILVAVLLVFFVIRKRRDDREAHTRTEVKQSPSSKPRPNYEQMFHSQQQPHIDRPPDYGATNLAVSDATYPHLPSTADALKSTPHEEAERKEAKQKASELMGLAKATIIEKARAGVDVSTADAQLNLANKFMLSGDYSNATKMAVKAMSLAMEAERRASVSTASSSEQPSEKHDGKKEKEKKQIPVKKPYLAAETASQEAVIDPETEPKPEELNETVSDVQKMVAQLKKTKDMIGKLRADGLDVDQAEKLLALAESFARDGNTDKATKYGVKAESVAFDLAKRSEIEKKELSSKTCPNCGKALQDSWIGCPYCKAQFGKSKKDEARARIDSTKSMLSIMEKLGEDVSDARAKLQLAESFLRIGEADKAMDYAVRAEELLNERSRKRVNA